MSSHPRKEPSPTKSQTLPDINTALETARKMPSTRPQPPEDHPQYTTNQWSIVSPDNDRSATGPVRKSRIGEVIRDTSLRRKPQKFPDWAVTVLTQWFSDHANYPYPTPEEKESLAEQTKLSEVQINYWFSNARRRRSKKEKQTAMTAAHSERTPPPPPTMHSSSPDPNFGRGAAAPQSTSKSQAPPPTSASSMTIPTYQLQPHFQQMSAPQPMLPSMPSPLGYPQQHHYPHSMPPQMPPPHMMTPMPPHMVPQMPMPSPMQQMPMYMPQQYHSQAYPMSQHVAAAHQLPPLQVPPGAGRGQSHLPFPSLPPPPKDLS